MALLALLSLTALSGRPARAGDAVPSATAPGGYALAQEGEDLVLRQDGAERRRMPLRSVDGRERGRVAALAHDAGRKSFVAVFSVLAELWELSLDPDAEPVYDGLVHDYRMGEGLAGRGFLGLRRTRLREPASALALAPAGYALVLSTAAQDKPAVLQLVQRDVRLVLARWTVDGRPDLSRAQPRGDDRRPLLWVPDAAGGPGWTVDLRAASLR